MTVGLPKSPESAGKPDEALRAYDRALALAPAYEPLKEARTRAQTMMWSRTP